MVILVSPSLAGGVTLAACPWAWTSPNTCNAHIELYTVLMHTTLITLLPTVLCTLLYTVLNYIQYSTVHYTT